MRFVSISLFFVESSWILSFFLSLGFCMARNLEASIDTNRNRRITRARAWPVPPCSKLHFASPSCTYAWSIVSHASSHGSTRIFSHRIARKRILLFFLLFIAKTLNIISIPAARRLLFSAPTT